MSDLEVSTIALAWIATAVLMLVATFLAPGAINAAFGVGIGAAVLTVSSLTD